MEIALSLVPGVAADALRQHLPGVISAYLFGSVAEGRSHRESDVDVAVLLDRGMYPRPAERFDVRLRGIVRLTSALGRDVDLVILNDVPPQFARRILTTGRPLLVTDASVDGAFRQATMSRAADLEPFLRRARQVTLQVLGR